MSHFNDSAAQWDDENKIKMMKATAKKVISALNLNGKIDIMDFGCGTGLFGLEFSDYAKTLTGIDTSTGMLDVFNRKIQGHPEFKTILIDLEKNSLNQKFDLIISSMAFHHLSEPLKMMTQFKSMLNPNGKIAIVDLCKEDGSFHPDPKNMGVKHFGFSDDELANWALKTDLKLEKIIINEITKREKVYPQFLAIFS